MKVYKPGTGGVGQVGGTDHVGGGSKTPAKGHLLHPSTVRLQTRDDASSTTSRGLPATFALRIEAARTKESELSSLEATLGDPKLSATRRGEAGVELATRRLQRDLRPDGAEAALNAALELAPHLADRAPAQLARAGIRLARGDTAGAQTILRTLAAQAPDDPEVALLQAEVHRQQMDPGAALAQLAGARVHVDPKRQPGIAARLEFAVAYASFAAGRPADTVRAARKAFELGTGPAADTRVASKACQLLRELVCPDFSAAHRPEVEAGLARATEAFQAGDWDGVQAEAQAILSKDPDEALAFHLFAVSEQRRVDTRPLIGPLDSADKRAALIDQLESVLAEAGATPAKLFVDWPSLNDVQRAKVAHSALLYGDLLPDMLASRPARSIHLVPPGESCTARDPDTDRSAKHDAFGRHWYGTRGWVGRKDVVIGLEDVEAAARGGYDTVTHELAHLAQVALQRRGFEGAMPKTRIALMTQGLGPDQVRSFDEALNRRFSEARAGLTARTVTDYASTCVEEYFAESMMAAANPLEGPGPNQTRLHQRDPKMAKLAAALFEDLSRLPR